MFKTSRDENPGTAGTTGTYEVPEQGGLYWMMGGVPPEKLPLPCRECLRVLSDASPDDLAKLLEVAKAFKRANPSAS